jgi:hypothetical protein
MINFSPSFGARIRRPKRGKYRHRSGAPVGNKPVKGKRRRWIGIAGAKACDEMSRVRH